METSSKERRKQRGGKTPTRDFRKLTKEQRVALQREDQRRRNEAHDESEEEMESQRSEFAEMHLEEKLLNHEDESLELSVEEKHSEDGFTIIDGSFKEGGGQILRNCFSLSAILGIPIKVTNIRSKRSSSGLKAQHLTGIQLIANMYGGNLIGGKIGAPEVLFTPGQFKPSNQVADTGTAGAVTLLMQIAIPCLLFGSKKVRVELKGGTNVAFAPSIDYMLHVFQPIVKLFGVELNVELKNRGFFPKGGGVVTMQVQPVHHLKAIDLTNRGNIESIAIMAFVSGTIPLEIGQRIAQSAHKLLQKHFPRVRFDLSLDKDNKAAGSGSGILITAKTDTGCIFGSDAQSEKGVNAEKIGIDAAKKLLYNLNKGGCVDEWLQDQLIIFCALAKGRSRILSGPLTKHTETSIYFSQLLTGAKFSVTKCDPQTRINETEKTYIIECEGIGFKNKYLGNV